MKVISNVVTIENANSIKIVENWYTIMNYMKTIPLSKNEAGILIQIGDGNTNPEIHLETQDKIYFSFTLAQMEEILM